jgi:hypothetical protein
MSRFLLRLVQKTWSRRALCFAALAGIAGALAPASHALPSAFDLASIDQIKAAYVSAEIAANVGTELDPYTIVSPDKLG